MIPKMIHMQNEPPEAPAPAMPQMADMNLKGSEYPYGLSISLTHDDLAKLNLDCDCEVGDMIHLFALAKVTSVSKRQGADGQAASHVELQITHLGLEDEDEENEAAEEEE